jgi:hypothetical protein
MTCTSGRNVRIGWVALATLVLTAGLCGDAAAKAGKPHVGNESAKPVQVASQQPGQMRYYGGPKSPMWREVR